MQATKKSALITGGGSGIGQAVAIRLAQAGWRVAIAGRRESELEKTRSLAGNEAEVLAVRADVSVAEEVNQLFARTKENFDRLDVLFNNAGIGGPPVPLDELALEDWNQVVNVNLTGAFLCAQHAIRQMKHQDPQGGRIINNGSISAHVPRPNSSAYTATKHAIAGLTKSISLEGRAFNIACSQIDIGNAATEMSERMAKGVLQANGTIAQEPRMNLQHVADAVLYMAELPLDANVQFMTLMATNMPFIGRG
ncbi:MAG TPA: SDR family oxidoreductase [Bryobacteraceae bacterium]|jgi:NAD(P)-dependent dehydrogenase (short-subunit alcohol dehydrogenase family)|nr:SDR family oxidoreductase [Bryobacteraceae bacterium]